jgi:hypothetical protein
MITNKLEIRRERDQKINDEEEFHSTVFFAMSLELITNNCAMEKCAM